MGLRSIELHARRLGLDLKFTGKGNDDLQLLVTDDSNKTLLSKQLWNNQLNPRDASGYYAKFAAPTIANGHVYLPTFSNRVVVYGLQ